MPLVHVQVLKSIWALLEGRYYHPQRPRRTMWIDVSA